MAGLGEPHVIDGLKGIARALEALWGGEVSLFQVWRAIRRRTDPLPAYRPLGRWKCDAAALREWATRKGGV